MYPRGSVMLVLAFSMEIVKYGSNFWKYKKWYNYQTLCPLFISHSASLNFVDPSFPSTKFLLSLRNFSSASHSISQLFVLSVCSSLYGISSNIRYVGIPEGPTLALLLYFAEWLNLFIWINFNFYVNSSKILAPVIHILFANI